MTKKTIVISAIIVVVILILIFLLSKFCFLNVGRCDNRPYLIRAKIIERSPEKTVLSDIEPLVVFDATDVIAMMRDDKTKFPPNSADTFSMNGEMLTDMPLNQTTWFKYVHSSRTVEKAF